MVNDYVTKEKHTKYINKDSHWFKAGSKMLARKDYENAKKCFKNIGRIDLV
jgi:outer membrane protein assembly factor BamD (BamD/ComL family)